jgi:hypothetical protein
MSKSTITIFNEEKITHKGENPDVKILLDKIENDGIHIKVDLNLTRHNFDDSCNVFFQAFNNRGSGLRPWNMGNIKDLNKKEINTFAYFVPNIDKEAIRFNLFVSKKGKFNNVNVHRIVGRSKIKEFYNEPDDRKDGNYKTESLLPTREDDIGTAFKVEMNPGNKPILILKRGCNIKHKLDNNIDPIQKTLIYTAALRELLKTYLSDIRYDDCPWKIKWFDEIKKKLGDPEMTTPQSLLIIDNGEAETNPEAERWIEDVVNIFVSNLLDASGKKLIDKFISHNNFVTSNDLEEIEI